MVSPVLSTKLYTPPLRARLVTRSRLVQRLEDGLQQAHLLTLVSAPAGFGKTTLISEWIQMAQPGKLAAWVSLDEGDNDPVQFLRYLTSALQQVDQNIGQTVIPALQAAQLPPLSSLVEHLINEISLVAAPFLLVLDDYHQVTSLDVHQLVRLMLQHHPAPLHTVIITREDPPLPLPKLRARGQMTEVRERDLRFTESEAESFLNQTMSLHLEAEAVVTLETRTEGWIAGLQLAGIALQGIPDEQSIQAFITTFAGSDRYIVDYLASEVLLHLPETLRDFLMRTSILERLCGPLCDAMLGSQNLPGDSQDILDTLERTNMFLVPLDNRRHWYRYHHLFADLLFYSLQQHAASQVPDLHRRASQWLEDNGFLPEAVSHAFKTRDWEYAAEVVEQHAMEMITHSQVALLNNWCTTFPEEVIQARPGLCIFLAWALMLTYRSDYREAVSARINQAEQLLNRPDIPLYANLGPGGASVPVRDWVTGHVCALRSQLLLAVFNTPIDPQALIDLSLKSLQLLPEVEKPIRATCTITLAHAHLMLSNVEAAENALAGALRLAMEAHNYFTAVTVFFYQARVAYYQGRLRQAMEICRDGLAKLSTMFEHPDQDFPAIRSLYVMQGIIFLEWNNLDEAERLLNLGADLSGWAPWVELNGYTALGRLWNIRGNAAKIAEILQRMEKLGPQHAFCADALRMLYQIRDNPEDALLKEKASVWAQKHSPNLSGSSMTVMGIGPFQVDVEYTVFLAWLQVQIAIGQPKEALAAIAPVLASAQQKNLSQRTIELSIIRAAALSANGELKFAQAALAQALSLAQPEGFHNIFNRGPRLVHLLSEVPTNGALRMYQQTLLTSFGQPAAVKSRETIYAVKPRGAKSLALVEPLSGREVEVLSLLMLGLTLGEVARRLYLSPNTLKAHTQNIYTKLDVHNRVEAVNKAHELGLV